MRALALMGIGQDSFERLQVGVDITENRETHCEPVKSLKGYNVTTETI
jgi:hypothetical protein